MPIVQEIVIDGNIRTNRLPNACREYMGAARYNDRALMNFKIRLDDGSIKEISFQQAVDGIHVHGVDNG